jgi:hypothetical protein
MMRSAIDYKEQLLIRWRHVMATYALDPKAKGIPSQKEVEAAGFTPEEAKVIRNSIANEMPSGLRNQSGATQSSGSGFKYVKTKGKKTVAKPKPKATAKPKPKSSSPQTSTRSKTGPVQSSKPPQKRLSPGKPALEQASPKSDIARATEPYTLQVSHVFPQNVDLFAWAAKVHAAGAPGSDVASYMNATILPGMVVALKRATSYNQNDITEAVLLNYINTICSAYGYMYSMIDHINLCYEMSKVMNLKERFNLLYSSEVEASFTKLARTLRDHWIPSRVRAEIDFYSSTYLVDTTPGAAMYTFGTVNAAINDPVTLAAYTDSVAAGVIALGTDGINIRSALSSFRYMGEGHFELVPIGNYDNPDEFLNHYKDPMYNEQALNVWTNLPLNCHDSSGVYHNNYSASKDKYRSVFGNEFSKTSNVYSSYATAATEGALAPGFLTPAIGLKPGVLDNTFQYINNGGIAAPVDVNDPNFMGIVFGSMARSQNNVFTGGSNLRMVPGGARWFSSTTFDIGQDAIEICDKLYR